MRTRYFVVCLLLVLALFAKFSYAKELKIKLGNNTNCIILNVANNGDVTGASTNTNDTWVGFYNKKAKKYYVSLGYSLATTRPVLHEWDLKHMQGNGRAYEQESSLEKWSYTISNCTTSTNGDDQAEDAFDEACGL